jgi:alkylhydroperoxidase family enzyme
MAKSDLRARPIFSHLQDSIEAHLTVVTAALAVSRYLQSVTGVSVKRLVRELRQVRSATIEVGGKRLMLPPLIPPEVQEILGAITKSPH